MKREAGPLVPLPVAPFLAFPCPYFPGCFAMKVFEQGGTLPEKAPFPQQWLAPISCGLWGGCSPSQPLLVVQWVLQLNSSAGKLGHLQVLPWKAKSCQQQAGAGFGWRPCAQTVMDSRQPTGSPQRFFGSWAARGSGPKATSVRRRVVGPGGEG